MLKSYGGWWVAYSILVSAQGPLVLGFLVFGFFSFWVLGLRVWGQGLTIVSMAMFY